MNPFTFVIFGITSNLAQRYTLPALYDMEGKNLLPKDMIILGNARRPMSRDELKKHVLKSLQADNKHHKHKIDKKIFENLFSKINYIDGNLDNPNFYPRLEETIQSLKKFDKDNRIYYLATYPDLYKDIFENLKRNQMSSQRNGFKRILIEKPIGKDLKSFKQINNLLLKYFNENQIYRIDHYLGKEILQNILFLRFGNNFLESLLDKESVDHIQITAFEDYGIGERGAYFDNYGMFKDVGQNHQLQMLALITMDQPHKFTNREITDQRIKILNSLIPKKLILGQYQNYQDEKNVNKKSKIDTFYAIKAKLTNKRFLEVPVYIRAGKNVYKTFTQIVVVFKNVNNSLFKTPKPNALIIRLYPEQAITFKILIKKPGEKIAFEEKELEYFYPKQKESHTLPDPYEKLFLDVINGDQTFFNDSKEVEAEWKFIDKIFPKRLNPIIYKKGTKGPKESNDLIEKDKREWLEFTS